MAAFLAHFTIYFGSVKCQGVLWKFCESAAEPPAPQLRPAKLFFPLQFRTPSTDFNYFIIWV